MTLVNRLLEPMNALFNRRFTASISPLLCADVFAQKEGRYLLFDRSGKLAMLGGIADKGEKLKTTAERECREESGYGCTLEEAHAIVIRDYVLGGPIPRISAVYEGRIKGDPVPNHEAQKFVWKTADEISALKEGEDFADHGRMMKQALQQIETDSICYMSSLKPLGDNEKEAIRRRVDQLKQAKEDFEESRDLLWPKETADRQADFEQKKLRYEKKHDWNDFDRLWDFLKPW